jgi:hypothetical protein
MSEYQESQISKAFYAAKAVSEIGNLPGSPASRRLAVPLESLNTRANQRALENLITSHFAKTGLEADKFEQIREQHQAELERIVAARKAEAVKHSAFATETFLDGMASRNQIAEELSQSTNFEILSTPFLIWPTTGLEFPELHYERGNSWSKFSFESYKALGSENVSFYFLWNNPSDRYAVINVDGYLVVNGFCRAGSSGGFWQGDRWSNLDLQANLVPLEWWKQPPTQPLWQANQHRAVLSLSTRTGGFFDVGAVEVAPIMFQSFDLRYQLFLVPPNETAVLVVCLSIHYFNSEGYVAVDFTTGDFRVICSSLIVQTLT